MQEQNENERIRRSDTEYKKNRYIQKAKKYQQGESTKFTYKKKDKKPGKCPFCMKLYSDR